LQTRPRRLPGGGLEEVYLARNCLVDRDKYVIIERGTSNSSFARVCDGYAEQRGSSPCAAFGPRPDLFRSAALAAHRPSALCARDGPGSGTAAAPWFATTQPKTARSPPDRHDFVAAKSGARPCRSSAAARACRRARCPGQSMGEAASFRRSRSAVRGSTRRGSNRM
jgi:hypothetical protein